MKFTFDASKPVESRVVSVSVKVQPSDPARIYTMAILTYLAASGGDGYDMLKNHKFLVAPEKGKACPMFSEIPSHQ